MSVKNLKYVFGGWAQNLEVAPIKEFNTMLYGMMTNLTPTKIGSAQVAFSAGTTAAPGWSPILSKSPKEKFHFTGDVLWTYGGGEGKPDNMPKAGDDKIIADATGSWDGVDFDDECCLNIEQLILTLKKLKEKQKRTSYGFIAGWDYNNTNAISDKVKAIQNSGSCDHFVHYCYSTQMWDDNTIKNNMPAAIDKSLSLGIDAKKIVLAITTQGLTDANLKMFLDQIVTKNLGGLYVWNFSKGRLTAPHLNMITTTLGL